MKYFFLLALLMIALAGQAVPFTFRVDMTGQTVGATGVHVAGTFQTAAGFAGNWNPATTALTDPDGDRIFEVTVNVPAGVYLYKFVNGNSWAGAEVPAASCGVTDGGGNVNRQLSLGSTALRLPSVGFGGCNTQVKFAVNMQGQTVSSAGVHVVGNFQALAGYGANGTPNAIELRDADSDGTYDVQLSLPAPGRFLYRFVNGNTLAGAETVPAACGTEDGTGTLHRVLDASAAVNTPAPACFASVAVSAAAVSLAVSSLPAGTYQATDLYSGQTAGPVTVNAQGGFSNWAAALPALAARQTWVLRLTLAQPTATAAAKAAFALQLYPNPATALVTMVLPATAAAQSRLTVYDLQGRTRSTHRVVGRTHTLDTSTWANGTYFVQIRGAAGVATQRLVVAH